MTHRTSFALDEDTTRKMKKLAHRWRVSQAEVLRRVIGEAAAKADKEADPVQRLREFHARGGLEKNSVDAYLDEINRGRAEWRGGR
jgi:hypothetical protein